jgi:hypothetical protein
MRNSVIHSLPLGVVSCRRLCRPHSSLHQHLRQHLVLVHAESVLGLVHETLLGTAVDGLVLAATDLVAGGLGVGLARVGLGATDNLVGAAGDALLGLVCGTKSVEVLRE